MIEYLLLSLLGCLLGVFTGIMPGIHVNTICLLGIAAYPTLGLSVLEFGAIMISMAVTHTFLDFIPAIFLGVPEEETALSVLPTHKMVLEGKAYEAVKITAYGSVLGLFFAVASIPFALYFVPKIYAALRGVIVYVLIAAVAYLIWREKTWRKRAWAAAIFCLSGWLGYAAFDQNVISQMRILFPVFTGLFGVSTIAWSLKEKSVQVPQQEYALVDVDKKFTLAGLAGALGGMIVGVLPAMSPSQVGIILSEFLGDSTRLFLVSVSAINTSDAIYSFISLYTIGNPRSGVATMLGRIIEVDYNTLFVFIGVIAFTAPIALALHIYIGKQALKLTKKIDYRKLNYAALITVLVLVYVMTGTWGLAFMIVATAIGILPIQTGVSRTHSMGILLLPTISYFLGF
ncbi:MAG: tripartite tricarboxylate transporter permease [Candidatus Altiarchaeota archaeon]